MYYLLLIYPLLISVLFFAGCRFRKSGQFNEEAWTISQSRNIQAGAALMIIIHHTVQAITFYGNTRKGPITEWSSFGIFFTSVFLFFSGFGLYKSYRNKENYLNGFFANRLSRILIPFMLINLIYLIAFRGRINEIRHVFTSILGLTLLNTNTWFIVELIILYIVFYVCFKKSATEEKALLRIFLSALVLVIFSGLMGHDYSEIGGHWFMGEWWYNTTLIFVMGLYVSRYEDSIKSFAKKHYKLLLPACTVLLIASYIAEEYIRLTYGFYAEWENHPGYAEKFITASAQTILCVIFMSVVLLINMKIHFGNRLLVFIGSFSFEIFLIHNLFAELLPGGLDGTMPDFEYIGLTLVLGVLSGWLLSFADRILIGYFGDSIGWFRTFRRPAVSSDPHETGRKMMRKWAVIAIVRLFYIAVSVGVIITECIKTYRYFF